MPTPPIDPTLVDRMADLADGYLARGVKPRIAAIADIIGLDQNTVRKYLRARGKFYDPEAAPVAPVAPPPMPGAPNPGMGAGEAVAGRIGGQDETREVRESGDSATVKFVTDDLIVSDEDVVRAAGYDPAVWGVAEKSFKSWTTTLKVTEPRKADTVVTKQNYGWTVRLKRIVSRAQEQAFDALYARMERHAPRYERPRYPRPRRPVLLAALLYDVHFGKLCWGREVGEDFDIGIAEDLYRNAVDDILEDASPFDVEEVLFPLGSDLIHIDGLDNATTAGTLQDVDSRYPRIIETVEAAVIWAIERAASIAPVRVVWKPGNHDRISSFHVARSVKAWFRNHAGVSVDCEPSPRKYHRYGVNLLGLAHGDTERKEAWASLMSIERPQDWAETTCREWLLGHEHRAKTTEVVTSNAENGVMVRRIRSLSATDAWHHGKAYIQNDRAAEGYLYCRETGFRRCSLARARLSA